ncbi:idi-3 precursor [Fusarium langsethiae]|uniref:Idi-3 n=1 Tax=Fusarium langsethiae TaxID=179993 RepID=A0A0M9ELU2_FUSLA|nr:idi-3 precursor [Fusarium langsethiae]
MLFKTFLSAAIAATSTLAAPLKARNVTSSYFTPSDTGQYSVKDGAITAASSLIEIYKSTGNGSKDQTALVIFTYPIPANANPAGSKKLDVFSSIKPAPGPKDGWGPGNQRGNHIGRLSVVAGGAATWDATYGPSLAVKTPYKAPGTVEAFELVGVWYFDSINWSPSSEYEPRIVY